jgi:hypothetical protein
MQSGRPTRFDTRPHQTHNHDRRTVGSRGPPFVVRTTSAKRLLSALCLSRDKESRPVNFFGSHAFLGVALTESHRRTPAT